MTNDPKGGPPVSDGPLPSGVHAPPAPEGITADESPPAVSGSCTHESPEKPSGGGDSTSDDCLICPRCNEQMYVDFDHDLQDGDACYTCNYFIIDELRAENGRLRAQNAQIESVYHSERCETDRLRARVSEIEESLGQHEPFPVQTVLRRLSEASYTLLREYNYDRHGWEEIRECLNRAIDIANRIDSPKRNHTERRRKHANNGNQR